MVEKRTGRVVKVLNQSEVVVNLGSQAGVGDDDVFVVYAPGEELWDPDTGESLGNLEIVRGRAQPTHVQEKLTTLRSIETRSTLQDRMRPKVLTPIEQLAGFSQFQPQEEVVTERVELPAPFREVKIGDLARRL